MRIWMSLFVSFANSHLQTWNKAQILSTHQKPVKTMLWQNYQSHQVNLAGRRFRLFQTTMPRVLRNLWLLIKVARKGFKIEMLPLEWCLFSGSKSKRSESRGWRIDKWLQEPVCLKVKLESAVWVIVPLQAPKSAAKTLKTTINWKLWCTCE